MHTRIVVVLALAVPLLSAQRRPLSWEDVMRFNQVSGAVISADGNYVAFGTKPDRGDGEGRVRHVGSGDLMTVPRGTRPVFSADSAWCAFSVTTPFVPDSQKSKAEAGKESKEKKAEEKPRPGIALVNLVSRAVTGIDAAEAPAFSDDGRWAAWRTLGEKKRKDLVIRELKDKKDRTIAHVTAFAFSPSGGSLAWVVGKDGGDDAGLWMQDLTGEDDARKLDVGKGVRIGGLSWSRAARRLGWVRSEAPHEPKDAPGTLRCWSADTKRARTLAQTSDVRSGWRIPVDNRLSWSRDGWRVFFGIRPGEPAKVAPEKPDAGGENGNGEHGLYDVEEILKQRQVDVWHWKDPRISTEQKRVWKREQDRRFLCVHHVRRGRTVCLADADLPDVRIPDGAVAALATTDAPYMRAKTWEGGFSDLYRVALGTGRRTNVARRVSGRSASLSPKGRYVAWWSDGHWHVHDGTTGTSRNLTEGMSVRFDDEDHDYPRAASSYGTAGWLSDDSAILLYDRFDVWRVSLSGERAICVTKGKGREQRVRLRVAWRDPDKVGIDPAGELVLHGTDEEDKTVSIYTAKVGAPGLVMRLDLGRKLQVRARAKSAARWLYTQETYTEFPDLRVSDATFTERTRVTDVNPQMKELAWGTSRLVEWRSADGKRLQGALFEPEGERPEGGWPTLVYYYRFMSQRVHEWNQPVVNHRPCFPLYVSNGYAIFLPDIRFEIGRPGHAAVNCLVPGVQKLVDMGVSDPEAVCLHGHSWSGYQTAYVITQSDLFACAIAGAPVSNMTSAYSGIRWSSGLARQFQYERTQSRLGKSLWEDRQRYLDNSPVFFADRIRTPLLIQFGDEDGAVPWYQGIELYLACRRLDKDCVFLQYRKEGHHLQKYANKLDYALRMRQYMDHYLKGQPAAAWIKDGERYQGK